jgi:hypothetical protein
MTWDDIETSVKHFVGAKTTTETLNEMTKITCNILLHVATGESNVTFAEAMQSNYLITMLKGLTAYKHAILYAARVSDPTTSATIDITSLAAIRKSSHYWSHHTTAALLALEDTLMTTTCTTLTSLNWAQIEQNCASFFTPEQTAMMDVALQCHYVESTTKPRRTTKEPNSVNSTPNEERA